MNIDSLNFSDEIITFLKNQQYKKLYEYQKNAINAGLLNSKNVLISTPTGNGKTLIGMLATLSHLNKTNSKIIYLVPSRALANEKYDNFSKLKKLKINDRFPKIIMRIGGTKLSTSDIKNNDIIIMTNEMLYFAIQYDPNLINMITLLIIDEMNLINEEERGIKLEILITLFKRIECIQIVALCPVIDNADQIANWMNAKCIKTKNQIGKIKKMVYKDKKLIDIYGKFIRDVEQNYSESYINISIEQIKNNKQILMYTTRKTDVRCYAANIHTYIQPYLNNEKRIKLKKLSKEILDYNEHTDIVCELAECVKNGAAFHHAGLSEHCLELVEREVKLENIMFLSCSKSLAEGVNFPIYSVIIANTFIDRKYSKKLTYQQICGRAGRPQYHSEGECIILDYNGEGLDNYIVDSIGELETQLNNNDNWINYIMDIIRLIPECDEDQICSLFYETINGIYFENQPIKNRICEHISMLKKYDMIIKESDHYIPTKFGVIPFSILTPQKAKKIYDAIKLFSYYKIYDIELLYLLSYHINYDVCPIINNNIRHEILDKQNSDCLNLSQEKINARMIILYMLRLEYSYDKIECKISDIEEIQRHVAKLSNDIKEIALYLKRKDLASEITNLSKCIQYNIKPELLDLIKFDGVGNKRARSLYDGGVKNLENVSNTSEDDLSKIDGINMNLSKKMKDELKKGIRVN